MQTDRPLPPWSDEAITFLTLKYPKFRFGFMYHKEDQIVAACPYPACKGGTDRFVIFANGNFWCRRCESKASWRREDPAERQARVLKEQTDKKENRAHMLTCKDWIGYHEHVGSGATLWKKHGIANDDIERWGLGFCEQAPCVDYPSASLTIPIWYKGKLLDIRHRLITPQGDDKYRSHMRGLPPAYFNFDGIANAERVWVVEGEKKAIVCNHYGLQTVAFPGLQFVSNLADIVPQTVSQCQELIFLPDPRAYSTIKPTLDILRGKGFNVKVLELIEKPDDFILAYGAQLILDSAPMARWF